MTQPQPIGAPQKQQAQQAAWPAVATPFATAASSGPDSQQLSSEPASQLLLHRLLHGDAASSQPEVMAAEESVHGNSQSTINCSEKNAAPARALSQVSVSRSAQNPAVAASPGSRTASKTSSGPGGAVEGLNGHTNSNAYMQHAPNLLSFLNSVTGRAAHQGSAANGHHSSEAGGAGGAPQFDAIARPRHHHHNPGGLPEYLDEIAARCSSPSASLFSNHSNSSEGSCAAALAPTMTSTHTSNPATSNPTSNPSGTGPSTPSAAAGTGAHPPAGSALQHHLQQLHQIQQAMHSGARISGDASRLVGSLGEGMGGGRGLGGTAALPAVQPLTPQQYQQYTGAPGGGGTSHSEPQVSHNLLQQLLMSSSDIDFASVLATGGTSGAPGGGGGTLSSAAFELPAWSPLSSNTSMTAHTPSRFGGGAAGGTGGGGLFPTPAAAAAMAAGLLGVTGTTGHTPPVTPSTPGCHGTSSMGPSLRAPPASLHHSITTPGGVNPAGSPARSSLGSGGYAGGPGSGGGTGLGLGGAGTTTAGLGGGQGIGTLTGGTGVGSTPYGRALGGTVLPPTSNILGTTGSPRKSLGGGSSGGGAVGGTTGPGSPAVAPPLTPAALQPLEPTGLGSMIPQAAVVGSASLYVKNLPPDADELFLYHRFAPHGALLSCKVLADPLTGRCRGVGFVNFVHADCALRALQQLHGSRIAEGRQMHITLQAPRAVRAAAAAMMAAHGGSEATIQETMGLSAPGLFPMSPAWSHPLPPDVTPRSSLTGSTMGMSQAPSLGLHGLGAMMAGTGSVGGGGRTSGGDGGGGGGGGGGLPLYSLFPFAGSDMGGAAGGGASAFEEMRGGGAISPDGFDMLSHAALLPSLPGITSASNNNILGLATSAGAGAGAAPAVAAATGLGGGPGLMQQHRGMGSPSAVQPPTPRQ